MAFSAHKDEESIREHEDPPEILNPKLDKLAEMVRASEYFVTFTGAGISTSAGIPDFRGPEGTWTLEAQGRERTLPTVSSLQAVPTKTHMALVTLERAGILKHLISQNCDGLHRKSGFDPSKLSELHGNGNMEECESCQTRFYRDYQCYRKGRGKDHYTGRHCPLCNGRLLEWTIDFGQSLPEDMITSGFDNARKATLHLCLGSSLTVSPACDMPRTTAKKRNGRLVVVNLQKTPLDDLCALRIYARTDVVMEGLMARLGMDILPWTLRRKFALHVENTTVALRGVDPFQLNLTADLFKKVVVQSLSKKAEPFVFNIAEARSNADDMIKIDFTWGGHYGEPNFQLNWPRERTGTYYVGVQYHPFEGKWEMTGVDNAPREAVRDIVPLGNSCTTMSCDPIVNRSWSTAVAIDQNNVLLLGGCEAAQDEGAVVFSVDGLKARAKTAFLSTPRWGHSACVSPLQPNFVFVYGGWDSECQYGDLHTFDMTTGEARKITTSGPSPGCVSQHAACVLEDGKTMLVFGGAYCKGGPYVCSNILYALDLTTFRWTELDTAGPAPSPRAQCCMVSHGGNVYVCGGWEGGNVFNDWYVLDVSQRKWVKGRTTLPWEATTHSPQKFRVPSVRPALTNASGVLVLWSQAGAHYLDFKDGTWKMVASKTTPGLSGHSIVVTGRNVVALGGQTLNGRPHQVSLLSL
jgi:mono-ADP-ribosyltransferase sirtuin 6